MTRQPALWATLCSLGVLAAAAAQAQTQTQTPAPAPAPAPAPLAAIAALEVPRYMGRWYEIAKFPNWFQRQCMSDTSATYTLRADGQVDVLNACRTKNGDVQQALGRARQVGGPTSARLEVRFAPAWLSGLPFLWGDYWVIDLDERYELVAVSEPRRDYLWILARTPTVEDARYRALLARLTALGLDTQRLDKTRHSGP